MEGLCKYWGIYLTAETETIRHGSRDMRLVILDTIRDTEGFKRNLSELRPGDDPSQCLLDNENIAERHFNCLLLVRLHILRIFLAIVDSIPPDPRESDPDGVYRKRWLEFQMRPSILNNGDIFQEITLALIKELPDMRMKLDLRALIDAYLKEMAPRVTPNQTNKSLYVVVDEVQHALEELPDAFRSKGRKPRPVFRPMLHSWVGFKNLVVVTAGTGVNSKILEEAMSSAVQKLHSYNQYYDTGSFGRRAESIQRAYIQRFIPPELINQPKFKALVARIIYWLKGR
jgi:hypothetical protein